VSETLTEPAGEDAHARSHFALEIVHGPFTIPVMNRLLLACVIGIFFGCVFSIPCAAAGPVYVVLWFDTEDYLLPADDDASKRLALLLEERGIKATFKLVGEKARVLEKRGRRDVIEALKRHDIGYHSDFHSVHPTPTEYLAECGFLDGIHEFTRREQAGAADVRRIFGVPTLSCYGQPGSSWAPQTLAALPAIGVAPGGVPCYVDEGNHVGLNNKPFWYENALVVYHMGPNYTRMDLHDPSAVEPAMKKVSQIADRLRGEGGGLISIFYHPCEWVHREFWDGVNFRRGANPPRENWKAPGQLPAEETEGAFLRFAEYIDYIRRITDVRFVTAADLPGIFPDKARDGVGETDLNNLVRAVLDSENKGLNHFTANGKAFSCSDQFEILTRAASEAVLGRSISFPIPTRGIYGPESSGPAENGTNSCSRLAFRDAVRDVFDFVDRERRVPAQIFIGSDPVSPESFLIAMARVVEQYRRGAGVPETISWPGRVTFLPEKQIAEDTPKLFGDWVIHKEGFRAPKVLQVARLQTWTLKPALLAK
jgi:hypothetical protein